MVVPLIQLQLYFGPGSKDQPFQALSSVKSSRCACGVSFGFSQAIVDFKSAWTSFRPTVSWHGFGLGCCMRFSFSTNAKPFPWKQINLLSSLDFVLVSADCPHTVVFSHICPI